MQQFTVPQFIDVEDKIIGPITTRQFIILMAGGILIAICYKIFDFSLFVLSGLLIFGISGTFAFLKINGRPFHFFVLNLIQTMKRPNLRIWNNNDKDFAADEKPKIDVNIIKTKKIEFNEQEILRKSLTRSRLTELSLIVDTRGAYGGEQESDKIDIRSLEAAFK